MWHEREDQKRVDADYCEVVSGYLAERRLYSHKPSTRLPRQRFLDATVAAKGFEEQKNRLWY